MASQFALWLLEPSAPRRLDFRLQEICVTVQVSREIHLWHNVPPEKRQAPGYTAKVCPLQYRSTAHAGAGRW